MAIQNTRLTNGTAANIFASTGSSAITTLHLCNTTGATVTCNVYLVTGAGIIASANNAIYANVTITAQNTYAYATHVESGQVMLICSYIVLHVA